MSNGWWSYVVHKVAPRSWYNMEGFFTISKRLRKGKTIGPVYNFIILANWWNHNQMSMSKRWMRYGVHKVAPVQLFHYHHVPHVECFHHIFTMVYRWLYTYSPIFWIEFVSKLSRQSLSPSTDHKFESSLSVNCHDSHFHRLPTISLHRVYQ